MTRKGGGREVKDKAKKKMRRQERKEGSGTGKYEVNTGKTYGQGTRFPQGKEEAGW